MPKIKDLTFSETKKRTNFLDLISPDLSNHSTVLVNNENKATEGQEQTSNKAATNRQQSDNTTGNKVATNRQQSENKLKEKIKNWQQSGNKLASQLATELMANRQQSGNKVATKRAFSQLVGLQRKMIIFIYHECKNLRARTTNPITLEHIAKSLKHSTGTVKTTLQRLEKKSFLLRPTFKNGRGGWSRYELPDDIYQEVLRNESDNKLATNWQQTGNKVASQLATEPATTTPSSSSNIKTTTTEGSGEWDFELQDYEVFGFAEPHLQQLAALGTLSAATVEQSLVEFYYDLNNNTLPPIKTSKLNFLMGLLRGGNAYVSENFRTEQQAAVAEMARRAKAKQQKLQEEQFLAWEAALAEAEKNKIYSLLPTQLMVLNKVYGLDNTEVRNWLFNYFMENKSKIIESQGLAKMTGG